MSQYACQRFGLCSCRRCVDHHRRSWPDLALAVDDTQRCLTSDQRLANRLVATTKVATMCSGAQCTNAFVVMRQMRYTLFP